MIRIEKLNKYYNKGKKNQIHVINNTNLELPSKGLVALLGVSGCGKTTLLNTIGGLDKVNKGKIYIDNQRITKRTSNKIDSIRNLKIGYIFQDYKLFDDMTVYENVSIVLKMIGIKDKNEIKKRVDYVLTKLGIYRYRHRPCGMLSGGERQRVGIARAIVKNPDIILADEPTGNLDSKNTIEIMNIIKTIACDKLVILVTHEVDLAKFYGDRIIELVDGKIDKDYINDNVGDLDYKIDNKFYLKDFKHRYSNNDNNINVDVYSDLSEKLNLIIVFKNGNIYIKNKGKDKIEVVDDESNIGFINENYKKLDKSVYEKYSFDYDKIIDKNIKLKYSSIFNIFTIFSNGFKKVFEYKLLKKVLLVGFFLSALFVTYSVSNLFGLYEVNDSEFIEVNKNYLKYTNNGKNVYLDYLDMLKDDTISYVLPGNSVVSMLLDSGKYYQFDDIYFSGSLVSVNNVDSSDILYGNMPSNDNEILIDVMTYDKMNEVDMVGLYSVSRLIGKEVFLKSKILKYKIVGIVSLGSPSIYVFDNQFINIIDNSVNEYYWDDSNNADKTLYDYSLYKDKLKIVRGREPKNDYEVIVHENFKDIFKLNKYIDQIRVNANKLKVVGYYNSLYDINSYFVNSNTNTINLINNSNILTIYSLDKEKTIDNFNNVSKNVLDIYEYDRTKYVGSNSESVLIGVIVAIVILVISLIEIIFMTRSSFLSKIKDVGIYRAIGVKKSDIYKMFIGESFAISTLTSLPGVLIMGYCLKAISSISYIGKDYVMNMYVILLCIAIIYLFNIVVGLIPVFNTMRKTPAQILSRHDLD